MGHIFKRSSNYTNYHELGASGFVWAEINDVYAYIYRIGATYSDYPIFSFELSGGVAGRRTCPGIDKDVRQARKSIG